MFDIKNRLRCIASGCAWCALLLACPAHANEPVSIELTADRIYDDNLFRLADHGDAKTRIGNSQADDVLDRFALLLNWNVPLSLQKVTGSAGFVTTRFEHNDWLNNDSLNTALGWEGEWAETWKGHVNWQREKALANFADFQDGQRNIITHNHVEAGLTRSIAANWLLLGLWDYDTSERSLASQQYNDRRTLGMRLGITGQSSAGSELKMFIASRTVDFVNWLWLPGSAQDDGLRQNTLGLHLRWSITGTTTAEAGARVEQVTNAHLAQNDFSGSTYDLGLASDGDGALNWRMAAWRKIDVLESTYANYVLRKGGRLTGQWPARSTWLMRAQLSREWLDYQGGPAARREDMLDDASLSLVYTLFRITEFSIRYAESRRDSSDTLGGYRDRILQLGLKVHWEK